MTLWQCIFRSLYYYRRTGVVVALGVAVATAVIIGALLVGDSVTGSIRDTALGRLGRAQYALVSRTPFRAQLAGELAASPELTSQVKQLTPLFLTRGAAKNPSSEAVIPHVNVLGVESGFWTLYPQVKAPKLNGRAVCINQALARDLSVQVDDALLISIPREGAVAGDTLFARRKLEETVRKIRVRVAGILPDRGAGSFALDAGMLTPRNVFINRAWLTEQLEQPDRANTLLLQAAQDTPAVDRQAQAALAKVATLDDYGLQVVPNPTHGYLSLESARLLLTPKEVEAGKQAAQDVSARAALTSVYLATTIRTPAGASLAYALVAAAPSLDATISARLDLGTDGIILNAWAAQDLQAKVGDRLAVEYLVPSDDGTYRTGTTRFTVRRIIPLAGAAVDPGLTPTINGITDADTVSDWSPPFPIDLGRVTPRDDEYWQQFRTTPKAFISLDAARTMWASGPAGAQADWITSLRIAPLGSPASSRPLPTEKYAAALKRHLTPEQAGLAFRPVRRLALEAAKGSTDFSSLFLSMSFFLVLSAAGLAGMLMRLMAERRAAEAGILLATGFTPRQVTRVIIGEGAILTLAGVVAGIPLGIGYAAALIYALSHWWAGAIAASAVWLHLTPGSIIAGAVAGGVIGLLCAAWGARQLGRGSVLRLLGGWQAMALPPAAQTARRRFEALGVLGALIGLVGILNLTSMPAVIPQAYFFLCGFVLLVGGMLVAYQVLLLELSARGLPTLPRLALRTAAANRGRSLLVIGLLASAAFIIVTVAANERDFTRAKVHEKTSGAGGFTLQATSPLPMPYDFGTPAGRAALGFAPEDEPVFAGVEVYSFLQSPGEDISCLNIARPHAPRLLGVPATMVARGGFSVKTLTGLAPRHVWPVLEKAPADGIIPAFGDADSVEWTLHSGPGKTYPVVDGAGTTVPVRFAGVIPGSIFASDLLVSTAHFKRLYPGVTRPRYFLIATPPGREQPVAQALRRNLGDIGLEVRGTREILNAYSRVQNTYLAMFLALGGLGVLLGTFGLVTVLLRNALERRREFAVMLATGFSRGAVTRLLMLENSGLLIIGLGIGTLAALLACLPQLTSPEAHVNWTSVSGMLGSILGLGLLSCALAARAAVRDDVINALREE